MKLSPRSAGFTLIELTIVLFIAGLLAALTVTAVSGYVRRGNHLSVISDVQALVRQVPLQAKMNVCAASLRIDVAAQHLEAWVCGVRQKRLVLGEPYSMKLVDHALKKNEDVKDSMVIWYSPRSGGAHATLDIYEGPARIHSMDLSVVTSYHAVP